MGLAQSEGELRGQGGRENVAGGELVASELAAAAAAAASTSGAAFPRRFPEKKIKNFPIKFEVRVRIRKCLGENERDRKGGEGRER